MVRAGRPWATRTVFALAAAVLLAGCSRRDPRHAAQAVGEIESALHQGRTSQALKLAEKNASLWQGHGPSDTYARFRLFEAEALIQSSRARDANLLVSNLRISPSESPLEAERQTMLARTLIGGGNAEAARQALDRACEMASAHGWKAPLLQALIAKGLLLNNSGDMDGSDEVFRQARVLADELQDQSQRMAISLDLGLNRLNRSQFDAAIPYLEQAHTLAESAGELTASSIALGDLAECYYNLGNFDRAIDLMDRAIVIQERIQSKRSLVYSYGVLGNIYYLRGEPRRAEASYQRSLQLALSIHSDRGLAFATSNLATVYIEMREWDKAENLNQQASAVSLRIHDLGTQPYIKLNTASIAAGRGDRESAIERYKEVIAGDPAKTPRDALWSAHAGLANLYQLASNTAQANEEYETALRSIERTRAELSRNDYKLTFLSRLIHFYQDYVELLIEQGDVRKALEVADSSRARLLAERLSSAKEGSPSEPRLDLQAVARSSNSILVSYWIAPRKSVVWVVTPGGIHMEPLPENAATIQSLVNTYSGELEQDLRDTAMTGSAAGAKLYAALVGPIQPYLAADKKVIIVPDGPLHNLNFETLPVPGANHYWIEDVTLSVTPSLGLLAEKTANPATGRGVLVMGNAEPHERYVSLPHAGEEIEAIRKHFPSQTTRVFTGPDATPAVYRGIHPEQFSLIHFTAHAEANRESPLDSAVILSARNDEYKLYGRDVMGMGLRARLVTVSACRSAGAKAYSGEGLVGFAWAFLHAGASNVIAGLWDADDQATARLMDHMYAGLAAGDAPDHALHEAKLSLIHGTNGNFRKPYYWGTLEVFRRTAQ